ncbi:signal transduction protein [Clostridium putrefaciens]|uniref:Signal transduction protein n=2 Tax=Clostridium putrefaciens TaxID=99675 RepID=A0A381J5V9_9CLOT|nr:signal transduction protein [Clostridium putrefaciens]
MYKVSDSHNLGEEEMEGYKEKYEKSLEEFEIYQNFAETQIQMLSEKNIILEKSLDAVVNIVEISKYINSYLSNENLIPMINDMIIGILGATYSSIYLEEEGEIIIKASNMEKAYLIFEESFYIEKIKSGRPFILNCKETIFNTRNRGNMHSIIGVPINLRERLMGYMILEHSLCNFFTPGHVKFISSIANQIAIAIENNILYKEIQKQINVDPLLGIYTRKYFIDFVNGKVLQNEDSNFAIVMIDLDDFKKINDSFGHQFGDEVLLNTVKEIKNGLGIKDIVARYGGEEIVLYIDQGEDFKSVYKTVDNIRKSIEDNEYSLIEDYKCVTATFGISFYPVDGGDIIKLLQAADRLLYKGKRSGKNKVMYNT